MIYDNRHIVMIGDEKVRFLLRSKGVKPLIVLGINPSTADENNPDNTIRRVMGFAERNGFDSFAMINVYPQRSTNPDCLHPAMDEELHRENVKVIKEFICQVENPTILVGFGNLITKRKYLKLCFRDIVNAIQCFCPQWKQIGQLTKSGNPRHPLMAKYELLRDFEVSAYINL